MIATAAHSAALSCDASYRNEYSVIFNTEELIMKKVILLNVQLSVAFLGFLSSIALAAGDPPRTLSTLEAQETFASYQAVLATGQLSGCPVGQAALSGLVTGGASPFGGSQTTALNFDGGATVTIITSWLTPQDGVANAYKNNSVTIKCVLR